MIPKKIHYCWFGGNPLPEETKIYIESWKKYCPDYEIIEWNEKNFDLNCNIYIQEAYQAKKWAFITDYVRLYVMYNYGGIYMDTDVEVIKSLDPYLNNKAFSGFETFTDIPTGIMASEKGFPLFKEFLDYYKDRHFIMNDGSYDMTTNVVIITNICKKYGLKTNFHVKCDFRVYGFSKDTSNTYHYIDCDIDTFRFKTRISKYWYNSNSGKKHHDYDVEKCFDVSTVNNIDSYIKCLENLIQKWI